MKCLFLHYSSYSSYFYYFVPISSSVHSFIHIYLLLWLFIYLNWLHCYVVSIVHSDTNNSIIIIEKWATIITSKQDKKVRWQLEKQWDTNEEERDTRTDSDDEEGWKWNKNKNKINLSTRVSFLFIESADHVDLNRKSVIIIIL